MIHDILTYSEGFFTARAVEFWGSWCGAEDQHRTRWRKRSVWLWKETGCEASHRSMCSAEWNLFQAFSTSWNKQSSLKDLKGLTDENLGSRQFMTIYDKLYQFMTIYDHLCQFMSIYDHLCQFMTIYDHLWQFELCVEAFRPISIWKQVPFFHGIFQASFIGVTWSTSRRRMVQVRP